MFPNYAYVKLCHRWIAYCIW